MCPICDLQAQLFMDSNKCLTNPRILAPPPTQQRAGICAFVIGNFTHNPQQLTQVSRFDTNLGLRGKRHWAIGRPRRANKQDWYHGHRQQAISKNALAQLGDSRVANSRHRARTNDV